MKKNLKENDYSANSIFVAYIGIQNVRSEDIDYYMHAVLERIKPESFEGEIIGIPIQSIDNRIECINPKYITNEDLISEHTKLINKLNEQLRHQSELLKTKNDEKD